MTEFELEQSWWDKLSGRTRARLLADPAGAVPAELIPEVVAARGLVAGTDCSGTQHHPDGFVLPEGFQGFVQKLSPGGRAL